MKTIDIVIKYLKENGFDGLVDEYGDCGCDLSDLMPCDGESFSECHVGYKVQCDCGDHDYHITTTKPAPAKGEEA